MGSTNSRNMKVLKKLSPSDPFLRNSSLRSRVKYLAIEIPMFCGLNIQTCYLADTKFKLFLPKFRMSTKTKQGGWTYIYMCICVFMCIYVYICVYMCIYVHICVYMCIYVYMYILNSLSLYIYNIYIIKSYKFIYQSLSTPEMGMNGYSCNQCRIQPSRPAL